jgi:hypothetical protein
VPVDSVRTAPTASCPEMTGRAVFEGGVGDGEGGGEGEGEGEGPKESLVTKFRKGVPHRVSESS